MKEKVIVITGILGMDGSNMAEYLLKNEPDFKIVGVHRRSANANFKNIKAFDNNPKFSLDYLDLADSVSIETVIRKYSPMYFLNFGANSFVGCSWDMPLQVIDVNALGVLRCLEAIKQHCPTCRFYSAGSSEEFGNVDYSPQDIKHPIKPRSPYGVSKATARHIVKVYRESYGLYAVHGILFNHEGSRRGIEFVTKKITNGAARIVQSIKNNQKFEPIQLGNVDAKRDWSDSRDFVDGIWRMINQEKYRKPNCGIFFPKDYVLASGRTNSVRKFVEVAFEKLNFFQNLRWQGTGLTEQFTGDFINNTGEPWRVPLVIINEKFYRPNEVELLLGDSTPAREELQWSPQISFDKLVEDMVKSDLDEISK
jgi:GDPmannose 4,6-dehydratase